MPQTIKQVSALVTNTSSLSERAISAYEPEGDRIATRLLCEEPALESSPVFEPLVRQGAPAGPALFIGDNAAIELFAFERQSMFGHRMALLANAGDVVLLRQRAPEFER